MRLNLRFSRVGQQNPLGEGSDLFYMAQQKSGSTPEKGPEEGEERRKNRRKGVQVELEKSGGSREKERSQPLGPLTYPAASNGRKGKGLWD